MGWHSIVWLCYWFFISPFLYFDGSFTWILYFSVTKQCYHKFFFRLNVIVFQERDGSEGSAQLPTRQVNKRHRKIHTLCPQQHLLVFVFQLLQSGEWEGCSVYHAFKLLWFLYLSYQQSLLLLMRITHSFPLLIFLLIFTEKHQFQWWDDSFFFKQQS